MLVQSWQPPRILVEYCAVVSGLRGSVELHRDRPIADRFSVPGRIAKKYGITRDLPWKLRDGWIVAVSWRCHGTRPRLQN